MLRKGDKILVVGDNNIIGASLIHYFKTNGFNAIFSESPEGLDLMDQNMVRSFFRLKRLDYVFLTYVLSGGIAANIKYPAEFMHKNLTIQTNVIHSAYEFQVRKLLFFGSSCMYPRDCPQPMKEEYKFSGKLEETSESYSIAKIAGIKMCESYHKQYAVNFISCVPPTLYGPRDHFDLERSHVVSSLIRKMHEAKINNKAEVIVWGSGKALREFMFIDDLMDAALFIMDKYNDSEVINIGFQEEVSIRELAFCIKKAVGFAGEILFDDSKPDGAPRKLLDSSRLASLGWKAKFNLEEGIKITYEWFLKDYDYHRKTVGSNCVNERSSK